MDIWANTVLTDKGRALQLKLLQGQTLQINRAVTGAGKVPEVNLRQQTNVTEGGYEDCSKAIICVRLDSMPKIRMKEKFYSVLLRHLMRNIFLRNQ